MSISSDLFRIHVRSHRMTFNCCIGLGLDYVLRYEKDYVMLGS